MRFRKTRSKLGIRGIQQLLQKFRQISRGTIPTVTPPPVIAPPDTTPPTVSISSPSNGSQLSSLSQIVATAADNEAIQRVEFYVDDVIQGTDTVNPYTLNHDWSNVAIGNHTIHAKAYDQTGNVTTSSTITINRPDTTSPSISITSPANNAVVSGSTSISVTGTDNIALTSVAFYVNNVLRHTDSTAPFSFAWDVSLEDPGPYTLLCIGYDAAGNSNSQSITVTKADATIPTILLTAPANGASISGSTNITATASDNVAVTRVVFSVDGQTIHTDTAAPYTTSHDFSASSLGSHTIRATAYDAANNSAYDEISITKPDTSNPTITITSPSAGSSQSESASITTSVSDNVGVTQVVFAVDGNTISTDNSDPFSAIYDFSALSIGNHTVRATATDAAGNSAYHEISITRPDTTNPSISISEPTNGAEVSGNVSITATASDNIAVSYVAFRVNGSTISTDYTSPYTATWDSSAVSPGSHTIEAVAYDAAGNNSSTSISVTKPSPPPSGQPTTVDECNALALAKVGFTVTLPTAPTISTTHYVTSNAEMTTALGGSNRRIVVQANLSGTFNVIAGRTDLQIEGDSYTMGTWTLNDNCARIKFIGGSFTRFQAYLPASAGAMVTHLWFDGCTVTSYPSNGNAFDLHAKYVRIEGCNVKGQYFSVWGGESEIGYQMSDWILFNNTFDSEDATSQATVRIVGCDKVIFCVNRCVNVEKHNFRIESRNGYQQQYTYMSYCRLVNRGIMLGNQPGNIVRDIWIEYVKTHAYNNGRPGVDSIFTPHTTNVDYLTFRNNDGYTNDYCSYNDYAAMAPSLDNWSFGSNTCNPYEAPPGSGV